MAAISIDLSLPAFSRMRTEFGLAPDSTEVSQLITTFFLGLAIGQLFFGPAADRFGRRPALFVGLAVFTVGATGAALSGDLATILVFRFVWGFGAAAPRSLSMAIVRDRQHGSEMARTMSLAMATFLMVPILAPALGTGLISVLPWRSVFWAPVVLAVGLGAWVHWRLPETLAPEDRRSLSPRPVLASFRAVVSNRQTAALGLAVTFLFGVMSGFVGSAEVIIDEVFHQRDLFPLWFGLVGVALGCGALLNAHLVPRVGVERMMRVMSCYLLAAAAIMVTLVAATGGTPPMWLFGLVVLLMMPGVTMLTPNCNTAAMTPLAHIAGTAAAVLGAVSTAGGALLGALIDEGFDGTVAPFADHAFVYLGGSAVAVLLLAGISSRGRQARFDDLG